MKFNCPYCRKECDFMDLQLSGDLRAVIAIAEGFGRNRGLVWAYAELFGITPLHAKAKKLRLILEEMKRLFDGGGFSYRKQLYAISAEGIAEALNVVVKKTFPDPLDSHNYLKKIMIGIADRQAKDSGRAAEKGLRGREARAVSGGTHREPMAGIRDVDDIDPDRERYPVYEEQVEAPAPRIAPASRRPESDEELAASQARARELINSFGGPEPSRRKP